MRMLTAEGRSIVEGVAYRHAVSMDAAVTLLAALDRGGGSQAQFSHSDLGGMGQWSRGGMIMIGDMFNNGLKFRVDQLCTELSDLLRNQALFVPEPAHGSGLGGPGGGGHWWPASCGTPSSSGSQNDLHYACFPDTRRLAIRRSGQVSVYDTGDHRINGFSQQQSDTQNLTFTSQYGTVRLYDLGLIKGDGLMQTHEPSFAPPPYAPQREPTPWQQETPQAWQSQSSNTTVSQMPAWQPQQPQAFQAQSFHHEDQLPLDPPPRAGGTKDDMFATIERLHELHQKGILSEAEYAAKKKDLLDRL